MPKMKTRRGAAKRFKLTATGKVKRRRGYLRHILSSKTRKQKRDFRSLWIVRINAAARANGMSYSRLVTGLRTAGVEVDRKMLAVLAVDDPQAFGEIAALARAHVGAPAAP